MQRVGNIDTVPFEWKKITGRLSGKLTYGFLTVGLTIDTQNFGELSPSFNKVPKEKD